MNKKHPNRPDRYGNDMTALNKINREQHLRSELPLSHRVAASNADEGPSLHNFTVSVVELLVVIRNWVRSKFCVVKTSSSVNIGGFNRPRSGGSFRAEGKMREELGLAKYRKNPSNSSATHRK